MTSTKRFAAASAAYTNWCGDPITYGLALPESTRGATRTQMNHLAILGARVRLGLRLIGIGSTNS